jgi:hypothetical protein
LLAVLRLNICLQYLDNDGAKGTVTNDLRRRLEERALEKEEEDYFNEDRYISLLSNVIGYFILLA